MNEDISNINKEENIDIKKFVFKILSSWYWFAITIFITLSIAFYQNRYEPKVYSISSSVIVRDQSNSLSSGVENIAQELGLSKRIRKKSVENEIAILSSYSMINQAIKELDYGISYYSIGRINNVERYKNTPFTVNLNINKEQLYNYPVNVTLLNKDEYRLLIDDGMGIDQIIKFGENYSDDYFSFSIDYNENNFDDKLLYADYYFIINDTNLLTNSYRKKLSVETSDKKSTVLYLSTAGTNARKEADFLNKLSEVYVRTNLEEKNLKAINTIAFIDNQLSEIVDSLRVAEDVLEKFRLNNSIINLSEQGLDIFKKLEKIQLEKQQIVIKQKYYKYLLNYISEHNNYKDVLSPSIMGISDLSLTNLVNNLTELYAKREVINYTSTENNPSLTIINSKIEANVKALIDNVNGLIGSSKIMLEDVEDRIKLVEREVRKLPETEKKLINIKRKFELNDNIYTYLMQKRAEAGIARASNVAENKVLDEAIVANAVLISPKTKLNYIIAFIIGVLIPLIIIIIKDFFNDKILERKDVEDKTNVPIIGSIGHNNKGTDIVVSKHPKSSITEAFRTVRTNLQYMLVKSESKCKVISVSSTISGEGKTFIALNIASVFAVSSKKTLIIGLDLRKPKLHDYIGLENGVGMSNYLVGDDNFDLDSIIVETEVKDLFFIPSGPIPPNPAELIEGDRMKTLLDTLKEKFDYIVIDTPPIALVTDALLINNYTDAYVYIVRQGYSKKSVIDFVNETYTKHNLKKLSILINDVKAGGGYGYRKGYGYNYGGYGYGYGYGHGYGYYDDEDDNLSKKAKVKLMKKKKS